MSKHFYHGSTKFFSSLKPNSWLTTYSDDARVFAIPWVMDCVDPVGRPTPDLYEKNNIPEDSELFIYKVTTDEITKLETNLGKFEDWICQNISWAKVELVEYYPSWHKLFGIYSKTINKNVKDNIENIQSYQ